MAPSTGNDFEPSFPNAAKCGNSNYYLTPFTDGDSVRGGSALSDSMLDGPPAEIPTDAHLVAWATPCVDEDPVCGNTVLPDLLAPGLLVGISSGDPWLL